MKFYVLKHSKFGYLMSKFYFTPSWTDDINTAKKWTFKSHAKSSMTQTQREEIKQCQVEEIEYQIINKQIL